MKIAEQENPAVLSNPLLRLGNSCLLAKRARKGVSYQGEGPVECKKE
ncbi:MAG: hypothetical protein KDI90_01335 [Alphaproteobacteria bacterium]|nr:hypothetical protein [Alphaproteobacteria bacterium]MCB9974098.1 hypothetical protein [Rhodospirillales bacterium]